MRSDTRSWLLVPGLVLALGLGLPAQDKVEGGDSHVVAVPTVEANQLVVRYCRPGNDLTEIYGAISNVYGLTMTVRDGADVRSTRNLQVVGDMIMVCDRAERAEKIVEAVAAMGTAMRERTESAAVSYVNLEYAPRYISLSDAQNAVSSFQRTIRYLTPEGNAQSTNNMTAVPQRGLLVIRDEAEKIQEIKSLLDRVDVPRKQVTMSCLVLRATPGKTSLGLSSELTKNLEIIAPGSGFEMVTSGVIRTAASGGNGVEISMSGGNDTDARLQIVPGGYDEKSGVLTLSSIQFNFSTMVEVGQSKSRRQQSFSTATTIPTNEYTVLGAFGDQPVFLVLHLKATN